LAAIGQGWRLALKYGGLVRRQHLGNRVFGSGPRIRALKFLGRALLHPRATAAWLAELERLPFDPVPPVIVKEMAEKIHRPYARHRLSPAGRAALLISHYQLLAARLPPATLAALVGGVELPLAHLVGTRSEDDRYTIVLGRDRRFHQQGELIVRLRDDVRGLPLSTLAINLKTDAAGRHLLFISGLQGPSPPLGKPEIVHATRSLNGLRPKRAVLEATYVLAQWLAVDAIIAVAKVNHVSTGQGRRWRDIRAEYDEFWLEAEPTLQDDGDFRLPPALPRRDPAEIPAKRRKEWLSRNARLEALTADTRAALMALAQPAADINS